MFFLTTQKSGQQPFSIQQFRGQMDWHLPLLSQVAGKRDPGAGPPQGINEPSSLIASMVDSTSGLLLPAPLSLPWPSSLPIGYLSSPLFFSQTLKPPQEREPPRAVSIFLLPGLVGTKHWQWEVAVVSSPGQPLKNTLLEARTRGAL